LKVVQINGRKAILENGIQAIYDKKTGIIKKGDKVFVYGNLIVSKTHENTK